MEQFINNKKYLLIFILFIVLLFIIIISYILKSNQTIPSENVLQTSPSPIPQVTTANNPTQTTNPTAVPPAPFTGAKDIQFTETEANQIDQERNLRRSSPYSGGTFTVTYNPVNDIFEVTLSEPKVNSQNDFEIWRKNDVPNVSFDRFSFK